MVSARERRKGLLALLPAEQVEPPCPHVKDGCGGCMLQPWPYAAQRAAKEALLAGMYGREVELVPCQDQFGYRNRMDFVTAFGMTGLRQQGSYRRVVDVQDCLLLPDHARYAYIAARKLIEEEDIPDYDYLSHEGFMRYLVVRTSRTTRETMLILTTATPDTRFQEGEFIGFLERLREITGCVSVHWRVNSGKGDMSIGLPYRFVGREWIEDEIADRRFRILPETFFQANTPLASVLFEEAKRHAKGKVLDLYSGVGVFSIIAAPELEVSSVLGVELVKESVEAAKENAVLNGVAKCRFLCADATQFLRDTTERWDTIFSDPSRPGMGKEACDHILRLQPSRIIMMSCNPDTHVEDLARLSSEYSVTHLRAYDLFPQTPHVEVLAVLERKEPVTFD